MTTVSDEYEKFIAALVKDISAAHRDIQFLCPVPTRNLMGALGQKHQIDVAFIDQTFIPPKLVLIECKLKNPKYHVGPEVIKIIAFNGFDLARNKEYPDDYLLIVCSTSDFTSGAKKLAEALSIKLERVSFLSDYTFRYANIIMAGVGETPVFSDNVTCEIRRVDGTKG